MTNLASNLSELLQNTVFSKCYALNQNLSSFTVYCLFIVKFGDTGLYKKKYVPGDTFLYEISSTVSYHQRQMSSP